MDTSNIEDIIQSSIEDAVTPPEVLEADDSTPETTEVVETPTPEAVESPVETPQVEEIPAVPETEVKAPGAKPDTTKPVVDDFEKKFGIPAQSSSGRENRIPYSRVKKITERAVTDAKSTWAKELEASHVPVTKYQELEAQNKDFTERFTKVAEFENVMMNDAPRFLEMLSGIPAYGKIFKELIAAAKQGQAASTSTAQAQPEAPVVDDMPQPDQPLADGSMVYSLEGLKSLLNWQAKQVETRVTKNVEQRYAPLESDYKRYQETQAVLPQVEAQIADARTWPLFNENEEAIVKVLQQYPQASLERAYQHIVWPKLQAEQDKLKEEVKTKAGEVQVNRDAIRAEILAELRKAPKATSVSASGSKPTPASSTSGPRSLEDIITESVQALK